MADDGLRKVVKVKEVKGDAHGIDLTELDEDFLAARKQRRLLVGIIVLLLAVLAGLAVVLFALTGPSSPSAELEGETGPMIWQQSIYQTDTDSLLSPTSVAVAPNGDIYVAEPQRSRVLVFGSDGSFLRTVQTSVESSATPKTEGEDEDDVPDLQDEMPGLSSENTNTKARTPLMIRPESIAVDDQGMLYVADSARGAIFVFDKQGAKVRTIAIGEPARGVAVAGDEIYALANGRVYVYGKNGPATPLRWFGGFGNYPGEINAYQGIEVKDNVVYIADAFNHRIQAFSTEGEFLWANPSGEASSETTNSVWSLPQDLAIDANGHIVVIDALNFALSQAAIEDGSFIDTWGAYGSADGAFAYPSSVAYDAKHDRFIVADTKNNRVQILTLPNSSQGVGNVVSKIETSPWRYILIPLAVLLLVALLIYTIYRLRKRRNERLESVLEAEQLYGDQDAKEGRLETDVRDEDKHEGEE